MNCIIIEDQPPAQRILQQYIADTGSWQLQATFADALQALEFLKAEPVDLIFLDIHLPKLSGLDFLKILPHPQAIILTTAFPDYALESYELDVVDYLLKPFSFQRFVKAISKVSPPGRSAAPEASAALPPAESELFIKSGYEHIRVAIDTIVFIRSDADYTELHLPDRKHLSAEPLRYWEEKLSSPPFVRVHKSYIINTTKIEKLVGNQVYLTSKVVIPIGRAYKDAFVEGFISR